MTIDQPTNHQVKVWAKILFDAVSFFSLFQAKMSQIYGSETAQALLPLLDNYEADVRKPEKDSSQERFEMQLFMDAVMNTPEMKETYNFLKQKGK